MNLLTLLLPGVVAGFLGGVLTGLSPARSRHNKALFAVFLSLAVSLLFTIAMLPAQPDLITPALTTPGLITIATLLVGYLASPVIAAILSWRLCLRLHDEHVAACERRRLEAPHIANWLKKAKEELGVTLPHWAGNSLREASDAYHAALWRKQAKEDFGVDLPDWVTSALSGWEAHTIAAWNHRSWKEFGLPLPESALASSAAAHNAYGVNAWRYAARKELGVELNGKLTSTEEAYHAYLIQLWRCRARQELGVELPASATTVELAYNAYLAAGRERNQVLPHGGDNAYYEPEASAVKIG